MSKTDKNAERAIPTDVAFPALLIKVPDAKAKIPARAGSQRAKRWTILVGMDGATVSDYYKACRDAGVPCTANNPRDAHTKGLVTLVAPPKAKAEDKAKADAKPASKK